MNEDSKPTIQELSIDTKLIAERLLLANVGEFIPYSELSGIIKKDIRQHRHYLQSARNRVQRSDQIVFAVIRGEGLKRKSNTAIANCGPEHTTAIRRRARKGLRELGCATEPLVGDDLVQHNLSTAVLNLITVATKQKKMNALEDKIRTAEEKLPLADMIDALK